MDYETLTENVCSFDVLNARIHIIYKDKMSAKLSQFEKCTRKMFNSQTKDWCCD